MAILKTIFEKLFSKPKPVEIVSMLCSNCFKVFPSSNIHIIPWWNDTAKDFFTTYRCHHCLQKSLLETRAKLSKMDEDDRDKFCQFLKRHAMQKDAEAITEMRLSEATKYSINIINLIEAGNIILSP